MSWSFNTSGDKAKVINEVNASTISDTYPEIERTAHAKAKELVKETVEKAPDDHGISVEASGYASWNESGVLSSTVSVKVTTKSPSAG